MNNTRILEWQEVRISPDWNLPPDAVVWIDVAKLERNWCRQDKYVGPRGSGDAIGDRYARFGEWIRHGQPIDMIVVAIDTDGNISFSDGRHRFAWLRDHGVVALPVQTSPECADAILRCFGSELRESVWVSL